MSDHGIRRELSPEQIRNEDGHARDPGFVADERIEGRQPSNDQPGDEGVERRERQEPKVVTSKFADKRARMFDSARQLRDDQSANPEIAEEIAESRRKLFAENVDQPQLHKEEPQGEQPQGEKPQPGAKRKLKVLGKEIELTDEEILAEAQKSLAAGDILDGAKRDRDLATELLRTAQSALKPSGTPAEGERQQAQAEEPEPTSATKLTGVDFSKVLNLIQIGTEEQGTKALQEFGEGIFERAVATAKEQLESSLPGQVRNINDVEQRTRTTRSTLEAIAEANPELKTDDVLQSAFAGATAAEMRKHILAIGVKPEKLGEWIQNSGMSPAEATGVIYRRLGKEHELPSHADIAGAAHKVLVDRKMLNPLRQEQQQERRPAPDNNNRNFDPQQRLERKREIAPQPRRAGAPPASDQPQSRDEQTRGIAAIRQMRANRRGRA